MPHPTIFLPDWVALVVVTVGFVLAYVVACMLERAVSWLLLRFGPAMKSECAWCRKDMGRVRCTREMAGRVTHGICPKCADGVLAQIGNGPAVILPKKP